MHAILLGLAVTVAAPGAKDPPKKEPPSIVGEWAPTNAVRGGKPDMPPPGTTITFKADGNVTFSEGKREKSEEGTYKIDAKKVPAEIDLVPPKGEERQIVGIYKFDKESLILCINMGKDRPTKFESPDGSEIMLITLQRVKKE